MDIEVEHMLQKASSPPQQTTVCTGSIALLLWNKGCGLGGSCRGVETCCFTSVWTHAVETYFILTSSTFPAMTVILSAKWFSLTSFLQCRAMLLASMAYTLRAPDCRAKNDSTPSARREINMTISALPVVRASAVIAGHHWGRYQYKPDYACKGSVFVSRDLA